MGKASPLDPSPPSLPTWGDRGISQGRRDGDCPNLIPGLTLTSFRIINSPIEPRLVVGKVSPRAPSPPSLPTWGDRGVRAREGETEIVLISSLV